MLAHCCPVERSYATSKRVCPLRPHQALPQGIRERIARSTLAHANELRDWRIYAGFAQVLIAQARKLYRNLDVELPNAGYALDATTIDLCLSPFPWAPFPIDQGTSQDAHAARSARTDP
jgi:hypothetical protein